MPALMGYMVAVVMMLGGYFAGLQWLFTPTDPWQPNPKLSQNNMQQTNQKRMRSMARPALEKNVQAGTITPLLEPASNAAAAEDEGCQP